MKRLNMWWFTGILFFTLTIVVIGDLIFFAFDPELTISHRIQAYCGGSTETLRTAVVSFLAGVLLAHLTGFGPRPPRANA